MKISFVQFFISLGIGVSLMACSDSSSQENKKVEVKEDTKIISLNGTITEVLYAADLGDKIVGVDVTSTFPEQAQKNPVLGHVSKLNVESMIGLQPTVVFVKKGEVNPEIQNKLKNGGAQIVAIEQDYSVEGTKSYIKQILESVSAGDRFEKISQKIDEDLEGVQPLESKPKVLFIYARGAGTLMVAGQNTQMDAMIELAGGVNAAQGFESFKPLTNEAVVTAAPDVILMFNSGKASLQESGVWNIPGISATPAGENQNIITMDAQFLSGFGPRLGAAVAELNAELKALEK